MTSSSYCLGLPHGVLISWVRALLLLLGLMTTPQLVAEFLQPVSVTVSNGEESKDALIDGQGFEEPGLGSPGSIHGTFSSEMWSSIGSIRAELVFDLGSTVDLTKVHIWNYNVSGDTDRGMRDVEVYVSSDANPATAKYVGIGRFTLKEGGSAAQSFDIKGTDVRLVKLKNTSNWGNGYSIGLAEVRFESGEIDGNVPFVIITGLKDGDTVPFGTDFLLSSTVSDKDSNLSKVEFFDGLTKLGETNRAPYAVSLKSLPKGDHTLRVVATDAAGYVAFSSVDVAVREVLPGKVIQIDDTRDVGTQLNQVRYYGNWNLAQGNASDPRFLNNDHYADSSSAYIEVKFVGVKIDVFATVASHHGTASAVIDGGTRYVLNYKAAQRGEQKLIWSSPLLPNREHTLKIAVLGTGVVTCDRFDVTQSDTPSEDRATVKKWDVTPGVFTVQLEDLGTSKVDPSLVTLKVDGIVVPVTVSKSASITTVEFASPVAFEPGSQHPFKIEAKDTAGNVIGTEASFTVPAPPFPLSGLGEPPASAAGWSLRQIWNAGRADAVVTAVGLAQSASHPGFSGKVLDVFTPVVNFNFTSALGNSGLFQEDLPFPGEAQDLPSSDWVTVARAKVRIPRDGDWTLGVHSDDGFALRFVGHPFSSVSGAGVLDQDYPEYMSFAVGTGDSNTRGVLKAVRAGDYVVELIHFQRTGGAAVEVYAGEGAFAEDADTSNWALIGSQEGLQLVDDDQPLSPFRLGAIYPREAGITIDFESPKPSGQHMLMGSSDLKTWGPVVGAKFEGAGGRAVRVTLDRPSVSVKFFRVDLTP